MPETAKMILRFVYFGSGYIFVNGKYTESMCIYCAFINTFLSGVYTQYSGRVLRCPGLVPKFLFCPNRRNFTILYGNIVYIF